MLQIEKYERDRQQDFLFAIALCLLIALVLVAVGAVIASGRFGGVSGRDRVEIVSSSAANITTSALLLGAVAALAFLTPDRVARARPLVVVALMLGTAMALLAIFSIVDILTVHTPDPNGGVTFGLLHGPTVADRIGLVLPDIGTVFVTLVALVGGNRLGGGRFD